MKNIYKIVILIFIVTLALIIIYFTGNETAVEKIPSVGTGDSIVGCYVAHLQKDIYTLVIQSAEKGAVFGMLAYNNYQKDSSSGSFEGTFADGILLGNYSFDSEGMHSDRQVIFKKIDDSFIQGFGDVKVAESTETFTDIANITYDPKLTFTKSKDCTENFLDANGVFSFDYNPFFKSIPGFKIPTTDWSVNATQEGLLLASVIIPKTYMPNTNFSNARFTIGRSTTSDAINSCLKKTLSIYTEGGTSDIGGYPFKKFTFNDAGAGNFYETTSYRGIVDGDCYAIEYAIHSVNIDNYPKEQGVVEFDKSIVLNDVEKMIKSFKFLINSD
ncbi:MAG: hypothetical protein WA060_03505 [Minisyncoccia bacterium]